MSDILLYQAPNGQIELEVNLVHETVWLSQNQMAALFGTKRQAITKHLKNIYISGELAENEVCSILEHTAADSKSYRTKFYSLDAIISVGYRVNSSQATQFRKWATNVLRNHLIKGYTINQKRLAERGVKELQQSVDLLHKTLVRHHHVDEIGEQTIQIIISYAKTWNLLLAYDENQLTLPTKGTTTFNPLPYESALDAITALKTDLSARDEATSLFGQERDHGLESILRNIEQTFSGKTLYPTSEERAAHLLYFVIKDHPFTDGNKRIACLMFLIYLKQQNIPIRLNENGLVALALLLAESDPKQKDLMIRLVVNLVSEQAFTSS